MDYERAGQLLLCGAIIITGLGIIFFPEKITVGEIGMEGIKNTFSPYIGFICLSLSMAPFIFSKIYFKKLK